MLFIIPDFLTPNIHYSFSFKPHYSLFIFSFHPRPQVRLFLMFYESEISFYSSLHHIFESKNFILFFVIVAKWQFCITRVAQLMKYPSAKASGRWFEPARQSTNWLRSFPIFPVLTAAELGQSVDGPLLQSESLRNEGIPFALCGSIVRVTRRQVSVPAQLVFSCYVHEHSKVPFLIVGGGVRALTSVAPPNLEC